MKVINLKLLLVLLSFRGVLGMNAQTLEKEKRYFISAFGFWNVENLYDTVNDPWKNDEDFTPEGLNTWTAPRYRLKIEHLAEVISQMAKEASPDGLALLGLCEVENKQVLQDLVNCSSLKPHNYQFIHIDGPDSRGVDPSLIYNPVYFKVATAQAYPVRLFNDSLHKTRDILVVSGLFFGEAISVLVNHWPSRRGGELASRQNRIAAAKTARQITDSITHLRPLEKLIIMGDLNDDPTSESIKKHVGTYADIRNAKKGYYFNPMEQLYKKGMGTLAWKDNWNLFDQLLLNAAWLPNHYKSWQYYAARIFNKSFLKNEFGNFKGYPLRTYSGGVYTGGYSDHFPVYIIIAKEKL